MTAKEVFESWKKETLARPHPHAGPAGAAVVIGAAETGYRLGLLAAQEECQVHHRAVLDVAPSDHPSAIKVLTDLSRRLDQLAREALPP